MEKALTFNAVEFVIVTRNNQPWVRVSQIATALGYVSVQRVTELYTRHADEFTDEMTAVVKLPTEGGEQDVRIFSLRGCHLLAMFARTPVAKAFRKWVLDVLDRLERERQPAALPDSITPDQQCTLQAIVKAKIEAIPEAERPKGLYPQIWSRFNNRFRLARYSQLPQTRMSEAVAYLTQMDLTPAALPLSRPLSRPALPPDALEAMTDSQRAKRFRRLMQEVRGLAQKVGSTMDIVRLTTHPGARYVRLAPELDARYNALDQMHKIAVAGLYQAEHMLYCLYFLGEGVEFR